MKKSLTFTSFYEEQGFDGKKNFTFQTDKGESFKCYDPIMSQDIMENMEVSLDVELTTSKNGKEYITDVLGLTTPKIVPATKYVQVDKKQEQNFNGSLLAPLSMWVSYAKDLFIAIAEKQKELTTDQCTMIMNESVKLVKLARKELNDQH